MSEALIFSVPSRFGRGPRPTVTPVQTGAGRRNLLEIRKNWRRLQETVA